MEVMCNLYFPLPFKNLKFLPDSSITFSFCHLLA